MKQTIELYESKAAKVMNILETGFDDATAILMFPEKYRKRLRTTNSQERLNEEVCNREWVIRIFPNLEFALRLIDALLMEMDEKWTNGRKYLDMEGYMVWKASQSSKSIGKVTRIS